MERVESLVFIHQPPWILLGFKKHKKKFGGLWNGFGGGIESGDQNIKDCAIRETIAETGITPVGLKEKGIILFKFKGKEQNHKVYFISASNYKGK